MAQVDLAAGRSDRACTGIGLGLRILQSAGLHRRDAYTSLMNSDEIEEHKRIAWSFFMLDRHYNASRTYSLALADKHFTLPFPSSIRIGAEGFLNIGILHYRPGIAANSIDQGILSCLIRLSSIWGKATEYIFEPLEATAQPPWQSGTALAVLESDWLQFQTHFADAHRYMNVDFRRRAREEPSSRAYLSTWLCVQFLFHSLQGFLHHPFVVSSKLRAVEGNIPSTFLQKCYESSLIHSRWIARFVREMTEVDMRLQDPFIGYLCAIAATIQLEHTVGNNQKVSRLAKKDYRILVDYVIGMSAQWENMRVLVYNLPSTRLNELSFRRRKYGSLYENQEQFSGILPRMPTSTELPRMSAEDEALMWDILDFNSSCSFAQAFSLGGLTSHNRIAGSQVLDQGEHAPPTQDQQATFVQPFSIQGMSSLFETAMDPSPDAFLPDGDDPGLSLSDTTDWLLFRGYLGEQL
ncbi:fungal specific transcription factor domain-containing protein [Aspergillus clavatus NRRL 1]|uniref:Fungal specific transcription factor domain protein n=1 Tax=Aspergillus clavatus (strain ATCC 1007 / CBS 513.65 / DSM 816 / NCTC 3887 / NRRL 1 / QM 1276 / 107) TaxID=344612 RepID=A1C8S7_ASPCL|nr:fungal specific transcription factor domain protein [Aspergillus clavatus NRRL 1]EAW13714.1 fungal specific transcription factor domain protein [Aspergillus clavatus NRRL 1]